jgi:hypothetical protein
LVVVVVAAQLLVESRARRKIWGRPIVAVESSRLSVEKKVKASRRGNEWKVSARLESKFQS